MQLDARVRRHRLLARLDDVDRAGDAVRDRSTDAACERILPTARHRHAAATPSRDNAAAGSGGMTGGAVAGGERGEEHGSSPRQ